MKNMNKKELLGKIIEGSGKVAMNIGQGAATGYCLWGFLHESKIPVELIKNELEKEK